MAAVFCFFQGHGKAKALEARRGVKRGVRRGGAGGAGVDGRVG